MILEISSSENEIFLANILITEPGSPFLIRAIQSKLFLIGCFSKACPPIKLIIPEKKSRFSYLSKGSETIFKSPLLFLFFFCCHKIIILLTNVVYFLTNVKY